jgi:hypothetical protein
VKLFKFVIAIGALCLNYSTCMAQETTKPEKTTTIDAWRQAVPQAEGTPEVFVEKPTPASPKNLAEIEEKLVASERIWLEGFSHGVSTEINELLGPDFTQASAQTIDAPIGKQEYLASAFQNGNKGPMAFDRLTVRIYGNTAIVSGSYSQRNPNGNPTAASRSVFTDVWVRREGSWKAVSRHLSQAVVGDK